MGRGASGGRRAGETATRWTPPTPQRRLTGTGTAAQAAFAVSLAEGHGFRNNDEARFVDYVQTRSTITFPNRRGDTITQTLRAQPRQTVSDTIEFLRQTGGSSSARPRAASSKQLGYAMRLAARNGMTPNAAARSVGAASFDEMTSAQASRLIDRLR